MLKGGKGEVSALSSWCLCVGHEVLEGDSSNHFGNEVILALIPGFQTDTTFTHVQFDAPLLPVFDKLLLDLIKAVQAAQIDAVVIFLSGEGRIHQWFTVVGVGVFFEGDFVTEHPPAHHLHITLRQVFAHESTQFSHSRLAIFSQLVDVILGGFRFGGNQRFIPSKKWSCFLRRPDLSLNHHGTARNATEKKQTSLTIQQASGDITSVSRSYFLFRICFTEPFGNMFFNELLVIGIRQLTAQ